MRLPESIPSWEAIPEPLLNECAQLVKANSIEGEFLEDFDLFCGFEKGGKVGLVV